MTNLAKNLKQRAKDLKLTDAAIAEKLGMDSRRYGYYATGDREPDMATLINIAKVLLTTPNALLGVDDPAYAPRLQRLLGACSNLSDDQIETITILAETLASKQ